MTRAHLSLQIVRTLLTALPAVFSLGVFGALAINFEGDATYSIDKQGHVRVCWTTGEKKCLTFVSSGERGVCDDVSGSLKGVTDYLSKQGEKGSVRASFELCIRGPGYMGMLCLGKTTSYNYCGYVKSLEKF